MEEKDLTPTYNEYEEPVDKTEMLVRKTTNSEQADADDLAEEAALSGAYDEANLEDEIETVMDVDEDLEDEEEIEDVEDTYAKMILDQCQGVDDENKPKATVAISLTMENVIEDSSKTLAQAAFCSAPVTINSRHDFVEVVLTYSSSTSNDMRVLYSHLQKYGELLNAQEAEDEEIASFKLYVVPHSALGSCFIMGMEPVFWGLCSSKAGIPADQIHILFSAELVDFYENDEVDLEEIDAEAQRYVNDRAEAYYKAEEHEAERAEAAAKNNAVLEELRKNGILR